MVSLSAFRRKGPCDSAASAVRQDEHRPSGLPASHSHRLHGRRPRRTSHDHGYCCGGASRSGKGRARGHDVLTFCCCWRENERRTDYGLSALLLSRDFTRADWVSWQGFRSVDNTVTYSGDITSAPAGAITADLHRISSEIIIPQVHIYSGEGFDEAAEAFTGFMLRGSDQGGAPFEPATVAMKSDLRGAGRVELPAALIRGEDGPWRAKWLHLYLAGPAVDERRAGPAGHDGNADPCGGRA